MFCISSKSLPRSSFCINSFPHSLSLFFRIPFHSLCVYFLILFFSSPVSFFLLPLLLCVITKNVKSRKSRREWMTRKTDESDERRRDKETKAQREGGQGDTEKGRKKWTKGTRGIERNLIHFLRANFLKIMQPFLLASPFCRALTNRGRGSALDNFEQWALWSWVQVTWQAVRKQTKE